ncbi:unnamed protein product [Prunus brigantina]
MEENQSILLFLHQKRVKYKDYFSMEIMDQVNLHRINDLPETEEGVLQYSGGCHNHRPRN